MTAIDRVGWRQTAEIGVRRREPKVRVIDAFPDLVAQSGLLIREEADPGDSAEVPEVRMDMAAS